MCPLRLVRPAVPFSLMLSLPPSGLAASVRAGLAATAMAFGLMPPAQACTLPAPGSLLTLAEAMSRALCHDPRTRQSTALLQAQAAREQLQQAARAPVLGARLDLGRQSGAWADASGRSRSIALELDWLLLDGGQREAAQDAARQQLIEAAASHDAVVQTVLIETAEAHRAALDDSEGLRLWRDLELRLTELQRQSRLRNRRADGPDHADVIEARLALEQTRLARLEAEEALALAQGRLAWRLGASAGTVWRLPPPSSDTAPASSPGEVAQQMPQWLEAVEREHPELRAARARAAAAQAARVQSERAGRPSLSMSARIGAGRRDDPTLESGRLSGGARQAALTLSLPLLDGGAQAAQVRAARAEHEAALAALDSIRRDATLTAWEHLLVLRHADALRQAHADVLRTRRALLFTELGRHRDSDASAADLADAMLYETEARIALQRADSRVQLARWRLALAAGQLPQGQALDAAPAPALAPRPPVADRTEPMPRPGGPCSLGSPPPRDGWCVPR